MAHHDRYGAATPHRFRGFEEETKREMLAALALGVDAAVCTPEAWAQLAVAPAAAPKPAEAATQAPPPPAGYKSSIRPYHTEPRGWIGFTRGLDQYSSKVASGE